MGSTFVAPLAHSRHWFPALLFCQTPSQPPASPVYFGTSMGAPITVLRCAGKGRTPQGRKSPVPQAMGHVQPAGRHTFKS